MMPMDVRRCACGSGLTRARCCDLDPASLARPESSDSLRALLETAQAALARGEIAEAERRCLDLLDLAPGFGPALGLLLGLRQASGPPAAVEALARRMVRLDPNDIAATLELALRLLQRGSLAEAEIHARNAVRIAPQNAQSHNLLGMILTESHRPHTGEYHYRRVLALVAEPDPTLLANLAWNLKNQGRFAEARGFYERSAAARPRVLQTLLGWARLEEAAGDFTAAGVLLDLATHVAPDDPAPLLARAILLRRQGEYAAALALLDRLAARTGGPLGTDEWLEKGRLLDRLGRPAEAFAAFEAGKRRARETTGLAYQAEAAQALAGRLGGFFTEARLATLPRAGVRRDGAQPIFILGFPRSGTTLVEQSLSAHPRIAAGDELPCVQEIAELCPRLLASPLSYPAALAELWMGDQCDGLDRLRDAYLRRVGQLGILTPQAAWFTDKMPLNETHLGLIALMFPAAPLIHVLRHPLDVMLSVFATHLTHGFHCAWDLESAARHYVLVMDLVAKYRAEMCLRYLPVRYEDVVQAQEGTLRRMLGFIGAAFDPACLRFWENPRPARSASYAQVKEPLYHRSLDRYRAYLPQLAPVIPILAPLIERLGYRIEAPA